MASNTFELNVVKAAHLIAKSRNVVALTGAGISAESGVPTFRGRSGLWSRYRPEELATPEAFSRNPRLVWEWYKWRMETIQRAQPNPGHLALAELERLGVIKCIITQNVDGLHKRAGSMCVVELHGNLWRVRCTRCNYREQLKAPPEAIPPVCPACGALLRPDVVWFGEPVPEQALLVAFDLASSCDTMLVVGTSGVIMPAGLIPAIAKQKGAKVIEVNVEESAITSLADVFIKTPAGRALPAILSLVKRGLLERKEPG